MFSVLVSYVREKHSNEINVLIFLSFGHLRVSDGFVVCRRAVLFE